MAEREQKLGREFEAKVGVPPETIRTEFHFASRLAVLIAAASARFRKGGG